MLVKTEGHPPIHYPANHLVGMRVPAGGSNCFKCEYVDGQHCTQREFVKWNKGPVIPIDTKEFCCDFFEIGKEK